MKFLKISAIILIAIILVYGGYAFVPLLYKSKKPLINVIIPFVCFFCWSIIGIRMLYDSLKNEHTKK